jgi:ankyrin repeat protein
MDYCGYCLMAEYLLGHGEIPNDNDKGMSALYIASFYGHIQMVKLLRGASPSWDAGCNCHALRLACEYSHTEIVKFLLESGVDVNAKEPLGRTALGVAVSKGHTEIVHLLFKNGAKIDVLGWCFHFTLSPASGAGYTEIIRRSQR